MLFIFLTWKFLNSQNYTPKIEKKEQKPHFKTVTYPLNEQRTLKVEYFNFGPKSAETNLKNGLKHQNTESYYASGEQFRSAAYFYDTLVTEVYFYKNGDIIKNFPSIMETKCTTSKCPFPTVEKSLNLSFTMAKS
ncbi:hypothetical protein JMN32_02310 [Fulvivirga sp. 29W222]|uniref:Uncharacterized protein n=1 Tax=Fulvivirga marina TaxID=2494733 RepID=A0A937FUC4_9BACT|nr:hypothetical protein [Fulvivirga marina]MBL6445123.1 hypothetical protein [Fulvivirga marina]